MMANTRCCRLLHLLVAVGVVGSAVVLPPPSLRVQREDVGQQAILALELINSKTDEKILDLENGTIVALNDIVGLTLTRPSFNILAIVESDVSSVQFVHNQVTTLPIQYASSIAPFTFCGTRNTNRKPAIEGANIQSSNQLSAKLSSTDFRRCRRLDFGNHTVTATPVDSQGQIAGMPYTVTFAIVEESAQRTTLPPVSSPVLTPTDATGEDVTPPELMSLTWRNTTDGKVDVRNQNKVISLQMVVRDDISGLVSGYVAAYDVNRKVFHTSDTISMGRPVARPIPLTFNVDLIVQQSTPSGTYDLVVYLVDAAGNEVDISTDALRRRTFPTTIQVLSRNNVDDIPPRLLNFSLSPTRIDLSSSDNTDTETTGATVLTLSVTAIDTGGFGDGVGSFGGFTITIANNNQANPFVLQQAFASDVEGSSGDVVTATATIGTDLLNRGVPGGTYTVVELDLLDVDGNTASFKSDDLVRLNFTNTFELVNDNFDDVSPELIDFTALSPTLVDVSLDDAIVTVQTTTRDDESGIATIYLELFRQDADSAAATNVSAVIPGFGTFYDSSFAIVDPSVPGVDVAKVVTRKPIAAPKSQKRELLERRARMRER